MLINNNSPVNNGGYVDRASGARPQGPASQGPGKTEDNPFQTEDGFSIGDTLKDKLGELKEKKPIKNLIAGLLQAHGGGQGGPAQGGPGGGGQGGPGGARPVRPQ